MLLSGKQVAMRVQVKQRKMEAANLPTTRNWCESEVSTRSTCRSARLVRGATCEVMGSEYRGEYCKQPLSSPSGKRGDGGRDAGRG